MSALKKMLPAHGAIRFRKINDWKQEGCGKGDGLLLPFMKQLAGTQDTHSTVV
jgi:hypothetical protein